jgi:hypothetical protein
MVQLLRNMLLYHLIKEMNKKISNMAIIENIEEQLFKRKLNKKEKEIIDECFELKFYLNIKIQFMIISNGLMNLFNISF